MHIKNITLTNFRNYLSEKIDFCENINIFYGNNGQGKTNIIEAIYFFLNGKSYRTLNDRETVNFEKDFCNIKAEFFSNKTDNTGEIFIGDQKSVKINGIPLKRLSSLLGHLNMVIFTPDHLNLIKGGPSFRRNFIDVFLSQIKPAYFSNLVSYYKVLKQKNNILKSDNKSLIETMPVWNEKLASYASYICDYRALMIDKLNHFSSKIQSEITDEKEKINIVYNPSIKGDYTNKEYIFDKLSKNLDREIEKRVSVIGPHRDDFDVYINDKNLRLFGSQGQQRTCVLSLKMAECEMLMEQIGEYPILLLDDIMSELDDSRKAYLTKKIFDKQVIITCTEKFDVNCKNTFVYRVCDNKVTREEM